MESTLGPDPSVDVLVIGIGNDGRADDGLGWAFVDALAKAGHAPERLELRFQLGIEDADTIRRARTVVFVDAIEATLPEGFGWSVCEREVDLGPLSHRLRPGAVLGVCRELYGYEPEAYLLAISGVSWGLRIGLSQPAQANLDRAIAFFQRWRARHRAC